MITRSYLIQRLDKPTGSLNPFSFGGGHVNGGLSDEGAEALKSICSFDYMGSAEFEFGALPKALNSIASSAEKTELEAYAVEVSGKPSFEFSDRRLSFEDKRKVADNHQIKTTVYVVARKELKQHIEQLLVELSSDNFRGKERTAFCESVFGISPETYGDCVGWLELDNGFFFTKDFEMFQNFARLFGQEVADTLKGSAPDLSEINKQITSMLEEVA